MSEFTTKNVMLFGFLESSRDLILVFEYTKLSNELEDNSINMFGKYFVGNCGALPIWNCEMLQLLHTEALKP